MIKFLAYVWAISAAVAWEAQAEALRGWTHNRWRAITIGSLLPIYNTFVAWGYVSEQLKARKK